MFGSPLRGLEQLRSYRSKRISSYDRSGKNRDCVTVRPGENYTFADIQGAGCISHIWITIDCKDHLYPRKLVLRAFWDGEKDASVEVPLGDFFGVGHGQVNPYMSLALNMVGSVGRPPFRAAMNCFFPMPFSNGARLQMENQSDLPVDSFYFYVDYEQHDKIDDVGRFHALWRRENPTDGRDFSKMPIQDIFDVVNNTGEGNYVILDAEGRGHYVGCNLSVHNLWPAPPEFWFGEGDDMIFIDGEKWPPSLHGTGTEDYFCAAWGFPSGEYAGPFHGISLAGNVIDYSGKWTIYRHHLESPVAFQKSIRVTLEHRHANIGSDDWSSTAYWYQTEPHKPFPSFPAVEKRLPRFP